MLRLIKNRISENLGISFLSDSDTHFKSNGYLTLGTEIELQLLDNSTLNLIPNASSVLDALSKNEKVKKEFFLSTLEINTEKCQTAQEIERDLSETLYAAQNTANNLGIKLATTGCHPFAKYADCVVYPSERYIEAIDRNQWLIKRMTVYGLHIHIGFRTGDECINNMNFLLRFIPHILALSGSSPYWQGEDTGLTSCRPTTYEALPTAGLPYWFNSWVEFEHLYETLKKHNSIKSTNDLWWDIRPSPRFGTLEIRAADGTATLSETTAIVAFAHLLTHWFSEHADWLPRLSQPDRWILRENKWRAIRYGLDAEIIINPLSESKNLKADILEWLDKLEPYTKKLGYEKYVKTIRLICEKGNSSSRQRAVFAKTKSLEAVVEHNVAECIKGEPIFDI